MTGSGMIEVRKMDYREAFEMIEGSILGDSSLRLKATSKNAYYIISQEGQGKIDRIRQLEQCLGTIGIAAASKFSDGAWWLWTHQHPTLTSLYHKWYPGNKKHVPADFAFRPASLASMFMDDGSSSWCPSRAHPVGVIVSLYSTDFPFNEVEALRTSLHLLGVDMRVNWGVPGGKGPRLCTKRRGEVCAFMDIVEPYVVPSLAYKIKRPKAARTKEQMEVCKWSTDMV